MAAPPGPARPGRPRRGRSDGRSCLSSPHAPPYTPAIETMTVAPIAKQRAGMRVPFQSKNHREFAAGPIGKPGDVGPTSSERGGQEALAAPPAPTWPTGED